MRQRIIFISIIVLIVSVIAFAVFYAARTKDNSVDTIEETPQDGYTETNTPNGEEQYDDTIMEKSPINTVNLGVGLLGKSFAVSGNMKKIAYSGYNIDNGMAEIWVSDIDDGFTTANHEMIDRCTVNVGNTGYWNITWLPDNSGVVFFTDRNYYIEVMIYRFSTKRMSTLCKVTLGNGISNIAFGRNSGKIYYVEDTFQGDMFSTFKRNSIELDSEETLNRIGFGIKKARHVTPMIDISPDERKIAYCSYNRLKDKYNIWIYDIATRKEEMISRGIYHSIEPRWSPDGKYISYAEQREDGELLYINIYDTEDGTVTKIFEDGLNCTHPVWTPDGKTIMYICTGDSSIELHARPAPVID